MSTTDACFRRLRRSTLPPPTGPRHHHRRPTSPSASSRPEARLGTTYAQSCIRILALGRPLILYALPELSPYRRSTLSSGELTYMMLRLLAIAIFGCLAVAAADNSSTNTPADRGLRAKAKAAKHVKTSKVRSRKVDCAQKMLGTYRYGTPCATEFLVTIGCNNVAELTECFYGEESVSLAAIIKSLGLPQTTTSLHPPGRRHNFARYVLPI